ncbi:MAG: acyltransferase family protein [Xanthomonadales bacterium]|nr:acyltransferase family protein [Xanthomonadales bacterium]
MSDTLPSERLHGLDALRGFALLLGVALHATMSYLPGAEFFWLAADSERSGVLAAGFHWVHSFRLSLFFLLAGFFGRLALHRLGSRRFVRDRCQRIVMPLLCLWFPVLMAIIAVLTWNAWLSNDGVMPELEPPAPLTLRNFPLTHLWFLYLLTLFYAAMLGLRAAFRISDRGGRRQVVVDGLVRRVAGPGAALLLALPTTLALMSLPVWWHWFGIPTPDRSLIPNLAAVVAYGLAFVAGWALHRQPPLLAALSRRWPLNLGIAIAASGICFQQLGLTPPSAPAGNDAATWLYAFAYAIAGWAWSLALIGLVLRYLAGYNPARRWLADASYWVFIVHLPLVMALQVLASRQQAPWWLEYPLLLAATLAVSLLSYTLLVRHSWLGAWLNGRRVPRPAATLAARSMAKPDAA